MSDPIPSASAFAAAAADIETDDSHHRLPTNAEDRKAAAALSSLNSNDIGADSSLAGAGGGAGVSSTLLPSTADQEALGKAMSRLEIAAGGGKGNAGKKTTAGGDGAATKDRNEADAATAAAKKKAVKVSVEDVNLLMDELDMSKVKATELLKMNSGDVRSAVHAFLTQRGGC